MTPRKTPRLSQSGHASTSYGNGPTRAVTPSRDVSRMSADALVLDGIGRQALVTTRALGRLGLRVTTAESSDLCRPRFGLPTFASRWSQREDTPQLSRRSTAYAQALLDLVGRASNSCAHSIGGRLDRRSPTPALVLRKPGCCPCAGFRNSTGRGQRQAAHSGSRGRARDPIPSDCPDDRSFRGHRSRSRRGRIPRSHQANPLMGFQGATLGSGHLKTVLDLSEALAYVEQLKEVGGLGPPSSSSWSMARVRRSVSSTLKGASGRASRRCLTVRCRFLAAYQWYARAYPCPSSWNLRPWRWCRLDLEGYSEVEFRTTMRRAVLY